MSAVAKDVASVAAVVVLIGFWLWRRHAPTPSDTDESVELLWVLLAIAVVATILLMVYLIQR